MEVIIDKLDASFVHALETRALAYFREVARVGSIAGASVNLFVAPSAISRQLAMLEAELGAKIIERGRHGVTLTPEGAELLQFASAAHEAMEHLRVQARSAPLEARGTVRVAAVESATTTILIDAIGTLRAQFPRAEFHIEVAGSHGVAAMVADGKADLGVTFGPPARADLLIVAQRSAALGLVTNPRHALAERRVVQMTDLDGVAVAVPVSHYGIRQEIDRAAHECGVTLDVVIEANNLHALGALAASSDLVTFLPEMALGVPAGRTDLRFTPIRNLRLESTHLSIIAPLAGTTSVVANAARQALVSTISTPR